MKKENLTKLAMMVLASSFLLSNQAFARGGHGSNSVATESYESQGRDRRYGGPLANLPSDENSDVSENESEWQATDQNQTEVSEEDNMATENSNG